MNLLSNVSLRAKFLLATFASIAALFLLTGLVIEYRTVRTASRSLEKEALASLEAYESLWRARADVLASVSLALSGMSDVRAAFGTGDEATIRDTAGERWAKLAQENAEFLVTDPRGRVIASFGESPPATVAEHVEAVRDAARLFPGQSSGFLFRGGSLYQVVITPVYVGSGSDAALLDVLLAAYRVDDKLLERFHVSTGGSEFLFAVGNKVVASTLTPPEVASCSAELFRGAHGEAPEKVSAGNTDYLTLRRPLLDIGGQRLGDVWILRSFEAEQQAVRVLRRDLALVWGGALLTALALAWFLAQRVMRPIARLDEGAAEVGRQNYAHRVPVTTRDELGRLADAFNRMCESLQRANSDLIRQERLAAVARLSSSLVHDLRNPLAAIYAGSEMLAEGDLTPARVQRLATNIHRASLQIKTMLDELLEVRQGGHGDAECCSARELIDGAWEFLSTRADLTGVTLETEIDAGLQITVQRARMQRVFTNLFANSIEAMPEGGAITVRASVDDHYVLIHVEDSGCGIAPEVREKLFEPFITGGKKNGMGLGLALARQTVADNGGELWSDAAVLKGARFCLRLPNGSAALPVHHNGR
ncbi:MAG: HAMP domain-containing sensor histidine kinase [Bryobacteraceae bacterium]